MWARLKNAFFEQAIVPVYNFWAWLFTELGLVKTIEKDPTKSWPYGHKLGTKVYYFHDKDQLGLESRLSRKFRGVKDD